MLRFHDVVRRVPIAEDVVRYAVRLAAASRPGQPDTPDFVNDWVSWGAGLRAGAVPGARRQGAGAAAAAARTSRPTTSARWSIPTLRHRILVGYRAEAEGVTVEDVIDRLLEHVPVAGVADVDRTIAMSTP